MPSDRAPLLHVYNFHVLLTTELFVIQGKYKATNVSPPRWLTLNELPFGARCRSRHDFHFLKDNILIVQIFSL